MENALLFPIHVKLIPMLSSKSVPPEPALRIPPSNSPAWSGMPTISVTAPPSAMSSGKALSPKPHPSRKPAPSPSSPSVPEASPTAASAAWLDHPEQKNLSDKAEIVKIG